MMRWVKMVMGTAGQRPIEQASHDEAKRRERQEHLIDVPHHVLSEEAMHQHAQLETLIKSGWPTVKREQVKKRVRSKVWKVIAHAFRPDDDMVDEITERIVDAAEVDPYYEKIFNRED